MKIIGIILVAFFLVSPVFALDLQKGEIVNIWIAIEERDDASFSIQSSTFEVLNRDGDILQSSGVATVNDTTHYIYGKVDTTATAFTNGLAAQVKFIYYIEGQTYIYFVPINIHQYIYTK